MSMHAALIPRISDGCLLYVRRCAMPEIPLDKLDDDNIRKGYDQDSIRTLAATMAEVGQQQPARIRPNGQRFTIIDGHRRKEAARLLGWKTLRCEVEDKELTQPEVRQRQVITSIQHKNLDWWEQGPIF